MMFHVNRATDYYKKGIIKIFGKVILTVTIFLVLTGTVFGQDYLPDRYHTYQEVLDTLTDLRDSFSDIMYLDTLGYSTRDSIPMVRVKISDNPTIDEDEPAVFFNGGVHADEVLSVEVALNFIQDIIERYSQNDQEVIDFINALEIFVVPFIVPKSDKALAFSTNIFAYSFLKIPHCGTPSCTCERRVCISFCKSWTMGMSSCLPGELEV